ncbi:hypothetical protein, partial [Teichococcus aerofrigidensis]
MAPLAFRRRRALASGTRDRTVGVAQAGREMWRQTGRDFIAALLLLALLLQGPPVARATLAGPAAFDPMSALCAFPAHDTAPLPDAPAGEPQHALCCQLACQAGLALPALPAGAPHLLPP